MSPIETLKKLFASFPGIGKRQAERFVHFLLRQDDAFLTELADTLRGLRESIGSCARCARFVPKGDLRESRCSICADPSREGKRLLVVASDVDLDNIERSGGYRGYYFVLGGTVPILEKEPEERIRLSELLEVLGASKPEEIIMALATNPEGENTREYLAGKLKPLQKKLGFSVTTLGRGLSTGAELEYSDPDTIKSALANRS